MRKLHTVLLVLCFSVVALSSFAASIGDPAPKIEAKKWVQGGPVEIKDGQVTVIEFWATWCPPCRASIPHINELYKQFKDKNVAFVGVSDEKTKENYFMDCSYCTGIMFDNSTIDKARYRCFWQGFILV